MNLLLRRLSAATLPQAFRIPVLLAVYAMVLLFSLWSAYQLRFEFALPPDQLAEFMRGSLWLIPLGLANLWIAGQFRSLLSYFSVPDLARIAWSQAAVFVAAVVVWYASTGQQAPPRSVLIIELVGSVAGLALFRLGLRLLRERYSQLRAPSLSQRARRIAVVGATDAGADLVKEMKHRPDLHMHPVAIFDQDPKRRGRQIHGVPILGSYEVLLSPNNALEVTEVIVARHDMDSPALRTMIGRLAAAGLRCSVAPSGLVGPNRHQRRPVRPIEIEDLLGREAVDLRTDQIRDLVRGRCVAVTGAGGSIGSELCRQLLEYEPRKLVLIEQCETQLFVIEQELLKAGGAPLSPCVADIMDPVRMGAVFRQHAPEIVFHAAAHKHVPMMEHQPAEAFQNNVVGTMRLAEAALANNCERFVLISSDKAINPTSVMGATKRLAEMFLQAFHAQPGGRTKFMAVRFGNVLGSSGSVVPIFKRQIAEGGPVTVTHSDVTRYFMVTAEAVGLVLQSAALGEGGEIFVLDMGTPIRILDLARQTIELSGLRPGIDIEIETTGLRPGEKLFEELNHSTENNVPTEHPKIMRFVAPPAIPKALALDLEQLHRRIHALSADDAKRELKKLVPEYVPHLSGNEVKPDAAEATCADRR